MKMIGRLLIGSIGFTACCAGALFVVLGIWGLNRGAGDSWVLLLLGIASVAAGSVLTLLAFNRLRSFKPQSDRR